ncbi:GNAT family N-acetyltransferase [Bacteriovoracaceae bacterium]|nr:GNAT family N-acetyltransferase [Bacteriovoracaceae bacterium]
MKVDKIINLELLSKFSPESPFYSSNFFQALIQSKSIGDGSGWLPIQFSSENELSLGFIKHHSYGEYIFDWAWADLYHRLNINYYPKLIHAIPFTPVNAPKVLSTTNKSSIIENIKKYYLESPELSGHHYLFTNKTLSEQLHTLGYFTKYSIQYHWANQDYKSFDDFLSQLKSRKRKQIKKERKHVEMNDLKIIFKKFTDLDISEISAISNLYISTIEKKSSYAYLRDQFFSNLLSQKWDGGFVVLAYKSEEIIAMSLFFNSLDTLYGRYWGIKSEYELEYKFLHFEMCYYQGIDYCIENKINLFEAGAQGEHKLLRGFDPKIIYSSHLLRNDQVGNIIKKYTKQENDHTLQNLEELKKFTPYKD